MTAEAPRLAMRGHTPRLKLCFGQNRKERFFWAGNTL